MLKMPLADAIRQLDRHATDRYRVLDHGDWNFGIYRPDDPASQIPNDKDALYVVAVGEGMFFYDGERQKFEPGDAFFVPAGMVHRFEDTGPDFTTWVIFFGSRAH